MTYDWNKMVDITVPTGTNGWMYSGEVIINGIKVKFPVGTPTTVPEPAAALLNKMIELEKEDDLNTAKPNNHYIGDVTVPEGKTLTIMKGAKVVDEDGALGGSSGSAPAEVVILSETVFTFDPEAGAPAMITTPWETEVVEGNVYTVTYNGTAYDLTGESNPDAIPGAVFLGNLSAAGGDDTGEPFLLACAPNDTIESQGYCGMLIALDGSETVTLSVVLKEDNAPSADAKLSAHIQSVAPLVFETTVVVSSAISPLPGIAASDLVEQNIYVVSLNGTDYECTDVYAMSGGVWYHFLGNISLVNQEIVGGNPDAPFLIMMGESGEAQYISSVGGINKLSVYNTRIAKQTEYLGVVVRSKSSGTNDDGSKYTNLYLDRTFDEIYAVFSSGGKAEMKCPGLFNAYDWIILPAVYADDNEKKVVFSAIANGYVIEAVCTADKTSLIERALA